MNHNPRRHITSSLLIAFFLTCIAGCTGFGRYAMNPRVTLADIQIQEIKTLETAFQIDLRVLNPNDVPLEVDGLECELKIDGKDFASGVAGEQHVIPPYGSVIIPVTVYASMLDMVSSVVRFVQGSSAQHRHPEPLRYELSGHVRLGGKNIMMKTVPFNTKGEISLPGGQ